MRRASSILLFKFELETGFGSEEAAFEDGFTLCCKCTTCDAVSNFFEAGIHVEHLCWCCLRFVRRNLEIRDRAGTTLEYLQHLKNGVMRTSPML